MGVVGIVGVVGIAGSAVVGVVGIVGVVDAAGAVVMVGPVAVVMVVGTDGAVVVGTVGAVVVGTVGMVMMVRGGGGRRWGIGSVEEPPEGGSLMISPVNGEATAATASSTPAAVELTTASATILTNDPDALLSKEMLLRPSAPKMMV